MNHLRISDIRAIRDEGLSSLHCALPGNVVSYDGECRTVDVQPGIRGKDGTPMPLLRGVPVFFMGREDFVPREGDRCLVIFADRCIDEWLETGEPSVPGSDRKHDLSDGFAFVGW